VCREDEEVGARELEIQPFRGSLCQHRHSLCRLHLTARVFRHERDHRELHGEIPPNELERAQGLETTFFVKPGSHEQQTCNSPGGSRYRCR
jgi:hypothetical protein